MSAQWTICQDTGFPARRGECVVHGGDACLVEVVPLKELPKVRRELSAEREKRLREDNKYLMSHINSVERERNELLREKRKGAE